MGRSATFWLLWFVGIVIAFNVPYLSGFMNAVVGAIAHITGVTGAMAIVAFLPLILLLASSLGRNGKPAVN